MVIGEWPLEKFDEFVDRWYKAGGRSDEEGRGMVLKDVIKQ